MKYLLTILLVVFAVNANATTYCQWINSQGMNCRSTRTTQNILYIDGHFPFKEDAAKANGYGYYEQLTVSPVVDSATEKSGAIQWSFKDNQITRTWLVEDKTTDDLNNEKCSLIRQNLWVMKKLVTANVLDTGDFTASELEQYQACITLGE